ncbi:MAG: polysaccharide deacetylase family protein [Streptococcaceae bacterium]|jgi:peptidoglycan/xylan/chitin deacetylase (PgdA/CDA1 family)|nr:polysaccharide deacetylase family protein [Streptococcaceae bacterium]
MNKKRQLTLLLFSIIAMLVTILSFTFIINPTAQPRQEESIATEETSTSMSSTSIVETTKPSEEPTQTPWIQVEGEVSLPILMYHDTKGTPGDNNSIDISLFEQHLIALKEAGFYTLTPEEAYKVLTTNSKPAPKVVWITFDDGYRDFYENVFPILQKYQMKATNFAITSTTQAPHHLSLEQMKEMKASNLVSIQSHTVSHLDLSTLTNEQQLSELKDSKEFLDTNLGQNTIALCFPAGRFNDDTLIIAKQAQYQLAVTTQPGFATLTSGLLTLPRIRIFPTTSAENLVASISLAFVDGN